MGRFTGIDNLRVMHGRSGQTALVVSGTADGTGAPTAAIVDPKRGVVWKHYNSHVVALRSGRAAIAVYNREEGGEPRHRPIRFLYPDLDTILKRPALRNER